jgi:hypothetical protein
VVGRDPTDTGQQAMKDASNTKFDFAFKVEAADAADANDPNSVYYFRGKVTSARENYGANDNVVRVTYNVAINSAVIDVPTVPVA